jgi:hypothetical protein
MFSAFDPPESMSSCARRLQTIVPAQALTLLNSPVAREQAAAFARRILQEAGGDPELAIGRAWLLAYGRPITQAETQRAREFLNWRTQLLASAPARLPEEAAMAELCLVLFNANEFTFVD